MTSIGTRAADAFLAGEERRFGNTYTRNDSEGTWLVLHGSEIARLDADGDVGITMAGYFTTVTKDRINSLARQMYGSPFGGVFQSGGVGYIRLQGVDVRWEGDWINITEGLTPELLMSHLDEVAAEIFEHPRSRKLVAEMKEYTEVLVDLVDDHDFDIDAEFRKKFSEPLTPQRGWEIAYVHLQDLKLKRPRENPPSGDADEWSRLAAEVGWSPIASEIADEMMLLSYPEDFWFSAVTWEGGTQLQWAPPAELGRRWRAARRSVAQGEADARAPNKGREVELMFLNLRFTEEAAHGYLAAGRSEQFRHIDGAGRVFYALSREPDFLVDVDVEDDDAAADTIERLRETVQGLLDEMGG